MSPEIVRLKNAVTNQDQVAGPHTAVVTLLEYGNFECIHCGQTYPVIKQIRNLLSNDYLNEVRYTGATHLQALLEAIKESDPEGRIRLPKKESRIRKAVGKLRDALVDRRQLLRQDH